MAFTMKDIKRDRKLPKEELGDFGKLIRSYSFMTDSLATALWEYAKFRVFRRKYSRLTTDEYRKMINELMIYCINKNLDDISTDDVNNNEWQILNEIGKAIYYGSLHSLFLKQDDLLILEDTLKQKREFRELKARADKNELEEYFRSLMV